MKAITYVFTHGVTAATLGLTWSRQWGWAAGIGLGTVVRNPETLTIADEGAACWVHCCSAMVTASAPPVSQSEHGLAARHEFAVCSHPHQAGSSDLLVVQARLTGYLGFIGVSSWVARENLFALMVTSSCSTIVRSCLAACLPSVHMRVPLHPSYPDMLPSRQHMCKLYAGVGTAACR